MATQASSPVLAPGRGHARGTTRVYPLMTRRQIEGLIAEGRMVFILNQFVVKADAWLPYHPGGRKSIQHMVGRDATDEANVLHSAESRKMMDKYRIGRIEGRWVNFVPPIQGGKFRPLEEADVLGSKIAADADVSESEGLSLTGNPAASSASIASSHASSRSASPVFDTAADETEKPRHRRGRRAAERSSPSVSSATSVSDVDELFDGMAHLDSVTRKEISLALDRYPSLDDAMQDEIVRKYRLLHEKIKAEGLYQCNYGAYAIEGCRYTLIFGMMLLFLSWGWYAASATCLGLWWHQLVFTAHDAGHMGITHGFHTDTVIGILIADFCGGLSIGWWKHNHNVHHIVTNSPEHDPDIEHMPFLAISHRFLQNLRSTYYDRVMEYDAAAKVMLSIQAYTYYIIMLFGRFNLYFLSWDFLIVGRGPLKGIAWWHRWLELAGQAFFWTWFGYGILYSSIPTWSGRLTFILISHMVTAPLHVQITLSHFAMSTADLGPAESFPQKMLRTTMDVDCPQWLDFIHGGLQFQAVHHLYPRIPRHNLRRTQKLVQQFCNEVGIPYALYGFADGNKQVIGRLAEVSRQAAILAKCQRHVAGEIVEGHGHHH